MSNAKLKPCVKELLIIVSIFFLLFAVLIAAIKFLNNDMDAHIEKVSNRCAEKGYGIKAIFTNQGDKFYVCNIDGALND